MPTPALPPAGIREALPRISGGTGRLTPRDPAGDDGVSRCLRDWLPPSVHSVSSALTERLNVDEVEAVVLHEYAHLQRYDDWACLAQAVIRALAGWHPAVWRVTRQLDIEREAARDRLVVQRTQSPVARPRADCRRGPVVTGCGSHAAPRTWFDVVGWRFSGADVSTHRGALTNRPWRGGAAGAVLALVMVVMVTDRTPPLVVVTSGASADVREDAAFMNGNTVEGAAEHAIDAQSRAAAAVDVIGSGIAVENRGPLVGTARPREAAQRGHRTSRS